VLDEKHVELARSTPLGMARKGDCLWLIHVVVKRCDHMADDRRRIVRAGAYDRPHELPINNTDEFNPQLVDCRTSAGLTNRSISGPFS
jgi:hypothetical protein